MDQSDDDAADDVVADPFDEEPDEPDEPDELEEELDAVSDDDELDPLSDPPVAEEAELDESELESLVGPLPEPEDFEPERASLR